MWRPPTLHRAAARRWALALDNQIKGSTSWPGLLQFVFDESSSAWSSWDSWPGIGVAMDCGADGIAAVSALQYKYDLNLWVWPDHPTSVRGRSRRCCGRWAFGAFGS